MLVLVGAILGPAQPCCSRRNRAEKPARTSPVRPEDGQDGGRRGGEVVGSVAGMVDAVEEKAEELLEKGKDLSRESREAVLDA